MDEEHSAVKSDIALELLVRLREYTREPRSRAELQSFCKISSRDYFRNKILNPLVEAGKIKLTIPEKPTSSKQRYIWNGETWLDHLTWPLDLKLLANIVIDLARQKCLAFWNIFFSSRWKKLQWHLQWHFPNNMLLFFCGGIKYMNLGKETETLEFKKQRAKLKKEWYQIKGE